VAQPLLWLMPLTKAVGMYLMLGYLVFKERPAYPFEKETGERKNIPSPISTLRAEK
jgi:hypothetical protein